MRDAYRALVILHVAVGSVTLLSFWVALAARKGGALHLAAGRTFAGSMTATVATALVAWAAVLAFDPWVIRPPDVALGPVEAAEYVRHIRGLFSGIAAGGLFGGVALALGLRALRRRRIVQHVGWILTSGAVAHTAFFVSILPKLMPAGFDRDPATNPLPWLISPALGALGVTFACRWARRRAGRLAA